MIQIRHLSQIMVINRNLRLTISIKCTIGTTNEIIKFKEKLRGILHSGLHLMKFIHDLRFNTGGII